MNLGEIRETVYRKCQEAGYTTTEVDGFINESLRLVAATVLMPEYKRLDVVSTVVGQAYCSLAGLTGGFSGRLLRVVNSTGEKREVFERLELLMDRYPTMVEVGAVEGISLEGSILWYQKIPASAESLTVLYYQNPPDLVEDSQEVEVFPDYLHRDLFAAGAAYVMFSELEEGIDGEKINTIDALAQWNRGIVGLRSYLARRKNHFISSRWPI